MKSILLIITLIFVYSCSDDASPLQLPDNCHDLSTMPDGLANTYVRITGVKPNPDGDDDYNELFRVTSFKESNEVIYDYYILDDENVRWDLDDIYSIPWYDTDYEECNSIIFKSDKVAQLLNSGDVVYLYDRDNRLIQTVEFGESVSGQWIDIYKYNS